MYYNNIYSIGDFLTSVIDQVPIVSVYSSSSSFLTFTARIGIQLGYTRKLHLWPLTDL